LKTGRVIQSKEDEISMGGRSQKVHRIKIREKDILVRGGKDSGPTKIDSQAMKSF